MTDSIRLAAERLLQELESYDPLPSLLERGKSDLLDALAAQPAPPADGEVAELVAQRYPEPVPVGQRPWEREGWCDAEGRCWFGAPQDGAADAGWILRKPSDRLSHQTVSLPAHALPLPAAEVRA